MTLRGPGSTGSTPRSAHAYSGVDRGPAWNARAFVAVILAIVAIALVIWFSGRVNPVRKGAGQQPCTAYENLGTGPQVAFLKSSPALPDWSCPSRV